jgi:hypothetical protein
MIREVLNRMIQARAKHRLFRRTQASIAATAKVNYRGLASHPPAKITIGDGTMFEGG